MTLCNGNEQCPLHSHWCNNGTCTCLESFGLSGRNCELPSHASKGSAVILGSTALLLIVLVLYELAMILRLLWLHPEAHKIKFNLAGRMYVFSWISLLCTLASTSLATASTHVDMYFITVLVDYGAVLFQLCALLNLIVGFMRFAKMRHIATDRYHFWVYSICAFVLLAGVLLTVVMLLPFHVASYILSSIFMVISLTAAWSPLILFKRAMQSKKGYSGQEIIAAACGEIFCFRGSVLRMLIKNESRTSLTNFDPNERTNSKEDGDSTFEASRIQETSRDNSSKAFPLTRTGSFITENLKNFQFSNSLKAVMSQPGIISTQESQRKKAEFFARALRTGRNILLVSLLFSISWILFAVFSLEKPSVDQSFTLASLFWAIRSVCLGLSSHILLKFSSHVYKRSIKEKVLERKSKSYASLIQAHKSSKDVLRMSDPRTCPNSSNKHQSEKGSGILCISSGSGILPINGSLVIAVSAVQSAE